MFMIFKAFFFCTRACMHYSLQCPPGVPLSIISIKKWGDSLEEVKSLATNLSWCIQRTMKGIFTFPHVHKPQVCRTHRVQASTQLRSKAGQQGHVQIGSHMRVTGAMVLQVRALDQQHQRYWELEVRAPRPSPHTLDQKLEGGAQPAFNKSSEWFWYI